MSPPQSGLSALVLAVFLASPEPSLADPASTTANSQPPTSDSERRAQSAELSPGASVAPTKKRVGERQSSPPAATTQQNPRKAEVETTTQESPAAETGVHSAGADDSGEEDAQAAEARALPDLDMPIYEPPLPPLDEAPPEPPAPPPRQPKHVGPKTSLIVGLRGGLLIPEGALWTEAYEAGDVCCVVNPRNFSDFAGVGPKLELNVGLRFVRHYTVFLAFERGLLSNGNLLDDELGGQQGGTSDFYGLGVRYSVAPDRIGLAVEIAFGYRRFSTSWGTGTELTAVDPIVNTRLGVGVDFRLGPRLTLSPMLNIAGGAFSDIEWSYADGSKEDALTFWDDYGRHTFISLGLGASYDLVRSRL